MSKIILRALTIEDAKISWQWRNKEEIMNLYSGHPFPVNYELEKSWYEKVMYSNFPTTVFAVDVIEDGIEDTSSLGKLSKYWPNPICSAK